MEARLKEDWREETILIGTALNEDDAMHIAIGHRLESNHNGEDGGDSTQVAGTEEYDPIEQWPTQVAVLYCFVLYCIVLYHVCGMAYVLALHCTTKNMPPLCHSNTCH